MTKALEHAIKTREDALGRKLLDRERALLEYQLSAEPDVREGARLLLEADRPVTAGKGVKCPPSARARIEAALAGGGRQNSCVRPDPALEREIAREEAASERLSRHAADHGPASPPADPPFDPNRAYRAAQEAAEASGVEMDDIPF